MLHDLGVAVTAADEERAQYKTGIAFGYFPPGHRLGRDLVFEGELEVRNAFSSQDLTALLRADKWRYNFFRRTQVRINPDSTVEVAGEVDLIRLRGYLTSHRVYAPVVRALAAGLAWFRPHIPFYTSLRASWSENRLTMEVQVLELWGWRLPAWSHGLIRRHLVRSFEKVICSVPRLYIRSIVFREAMMRVDMRMPSNITWAKEDVSYS